MSNIKNFIQPSLVILLSLLLFSVNYRINSGMLFIVSVISAIAILALCITSMVKHNESKLSNILFGISIALIFVETGLLHVGLHSQSD